ncbi:MAG: sigma-70 family RNA polymerase sigma factor [Acidobacteriaceae bacterium]|nr:sigma-70 family RNA polymerase sigma factor [Acidobacteriaceae bacterium]MBV9297302.1 sigma-70 family RNA polymerase sigma factor [Acidobacteriaceae bacterium]MBV9763781.1 sigma-70 family RNA polymerase sigma factor [Acidobacteriaceae bacterium]
MSGEKRAHDEDEPQESLSVVYAELRKIAKAFLRRERRDNSLQTTLLVNEAYLRLRARDSMIASDRTRFLMIAAGMMRRILVDFARRRRAVKRGGEIPHIPIEEWHRPDVMSLDRVLDIDRALSKLENLDKRQSEIVAMRFFAGLSEEEIAEAMEVSVRTVKREWSTAKAWLYNELL